jgi:hypothetical protein
MSPFIIQNAPDTGASMLYVFTQLRGSRKPVPPATCARTVREARTSGRSLADVGHVTSSCHPPTNRRAFNSHTVSSACRLRKLFI